MSPSVPFIIVAFFISLSLTSAKIQAENVGNVPLDEVCSRFVRADNPKVHGARREGLMRECREIIRCHKRIQNEDLSAYKMQRKCGSLVMLAQFKSIGLNSVYEDGVFGDCNPKKSPFPPYCPFDMKLLEPPPRPMTMKTFSMHRPKPPEGVEI